MQVISSLGFPQAVGSATMWIPFLSFLSLAFSPAENTGFWIFEIWILDVGFLRVLDFGSWILDFGSWILVDLGFEIWYPQLLSACPESLVLSMFLWCHRALAKSWVLGFEILIPSTTKCPESLVLSMFVWCHRALAIEILDLRFWCPQLLSV